MNIMKNVFIVLFTISLQTTFISLIGREPGIASSVPRSHVQTSFFGQKELDDFIRTVSNFEVKKDQESSEAVNEALKSLTIFLGRINGYLNFCRLIDKSTQYINAYLKSNNPTDNEFELAIKGIKKIKNIIVHEKNYIEQRKISFNNN